MICQSVFDMRLGLLVIYNSLSERVVLADCTNHIVFGPGHIITYKTIQSVSANIFLKGDFVWRRGEDHFDLIFDNFIFLVHEK